MSERAIVPMYFEIQCSGGCVAYADRVTAGTIPDQCYTGTRARAWGGSAPGNAGKVDRCGVISTGRDTASEEGGRVSENGLARRVHVDSEVVNINRDHLIAVVAEVGIRDAGAGASQKLDRPASSAVHGNSYCHRAAIWNGPKGAI